MKKIIYLMIYCLSPLLLQASEELSDQERAQHLVETVLLQPMEKMEEPGQRFSRRVLMKPRCEWGPVLDNGLQSFVLRSSSAKSYLGLYEKEGAKLYLLNTRSKRYVLAAEHPYFTQLQNSILLPEERSSVP